MIDLLRTRRSIRKFTETPIEKEKLELLKEALLRSPTLKNSNSLEFIFVGNREMIQKLAKSKPSWHHRAIKKAILGGSGLVSKGHRNPWFFFPRRVAFTPWESGFNGHHLHQWQGDWP